MERTWTNVLVLLVVYQKMASGDLQLRGPLKDGDKVDIYCQPTLERTTDLVVWFRVLNQAKMEFIASFSNGVKKDPESQLPGFSYKKIGSHLLTLIFDRERDSGLYGCASLFKGKELRFGQVTQLIGEKVQRPEPTVAGTTPGPVTSATACPCKGGSKSSRSVPSLFCEPLVLGPLAGGCGLLLLLLIVTILYCNRVRTRRCPHHYKRKPRAKPAGNK